MTLKLDPDIYDEDSVFNQLFAAETKPRRPTQADRMARIFAEALETESPTNEIDIKVSDFLPRF